MGKTLKKWKNRAKKHFRTIKLLHYRSFGLYIFQTSDLDPLKPSTTTNDSN